jgi:hypothetical protein
VDEEPDLEQSEQVVTPSEWTGADAHKLEYITAMLELVREDIRHVMLRVTAAFAISALFVTQIPLEAIIAVPQWSRALLVVGLLAMVLAGLFYFRYVTCLHRTQMAIVQCLPSLDTAKTHELWAGEVEAPSCQVLARYDVVRSWDAAVGRRAGTHLCLPADMTCMRSSSTVPSYSPVGSRDGTFTTSPPSRCAAQSFLP